MHDHLDTECKSHAGSKFFWVDILKNFFNNRYILMYVESVHNVVIFSYGALKHLTHLVVPTLMLTFSVTFCISIANTK